MYVGVLPGVTRALRLSQRVLDYALGKTQVSLGENETALGVVVIPHQTGLAGSSIQS